MIDIAKSDETMTPTQIDVAGKVAAGLAFGLFTWVLNGRPPCVWEWVFFAAVFPFVNRSLFHIARRLQL
jgi:hypothetical protein